ncbi:inorganic phosphate transporter family protein [Halomicroarcula limicola]|uniref:Phosphate transporter n=1 Tax=Haloarcula limicola TaxID=1429915 RepID=A0A8J8C861_9EURY|nr:inorganic phosphate transporter [Halomicroarcula limicola]MBV0925738.1 inorganic phosphate transporter family protein [Halomicroarcula limicola]
MVEVLFALGLVVAVFVGFNIGGSSTGVAFGPAVGSETLSKLSAAALMTVFALAGGLLVGPAVVESLGSDLVETAFSPLISIVVLFFIGVALFLSNVVGVPASTSMTAVGAIAGLGLAEQTLNGGLMLEIVSWWLVSPIVAFWVSGVIGRYFYPTLVEWFAVSQSEGSLLVMDYSGAIPRPRLGEHTTQREFVGTAVVVGIGCYMAFSAGASNVANAVAPLVGNGSLEMYPAIALGGAAIGLGAFTIARRTMDTVGNDLTDLPLVAAIVVATVSSTIVTFLSALGIPASFVIIATMSIVGLGWGRATRTTQLSESVREASTAPVESLAADDAPTVGGETSSGPKLRESERGETLREDVPSASDLFEPGTTARVIFLQNVVPSIATVAAYLVFRFLPVT